MDLPTPTPGEITLIMILYVFVNNILPKLVPDALKIWSKTNTREDRLFNIIEQSNERDRDIAVAITKLTDAMEGFDKRLAAIENKCRS